MCRDLSCAGHFGKWGTGMKCDILIAGVGGQGTVLASRLIAAASMEQGWFVRTAETIGMAQRGGCVVSHVRIDSEQKSSMIPFGKADLLIGFEPAEALRHLLRVAPGGNCVVNTKAIIPAVVPLSGKTYDWQAILDVLGQRENTILIDATALALQAGSVKTVNIVLLGIASGYGFFPFSHAALEAAVAEHIPRKFRELNLTALSLGYQASRSR